MQEPALHVPPKHAVAPLQHGSPLKPQDTHCAGVVVVEQTALVSEQMLPGQHGSPELPHGVQVLLVGLQSSWNEEVDVGHVLPGQHAWPSLPHDAQVPPELQ
jgi:hypothetical protein